LSAAFTHVVKAFSTVTTEQPPDEARITSEGQIKDPLDARAAYAAIAARAQGHNQLQWQTPSLALTAEAFLLQIALGHESTAPARLVASALNLVLSLLCIQLMAKHREMQIDDRQILIRLETRLGLPTYHEKPRVDDLSPWKRHLRTSSTTLWMIGFGILSAVALGILIFTVGRLLWDFLDLCDSTF
jgi:hypothetical protein